MIKVIICGGSGYTGGELLRILSLHKGVAVAGVTSEKSAGKSVTHLFPHLLNYSHLVYEPLDRETIVRKADLFFMALPHGTSQEAVDFFLNKGKTVIDLSADYRIRNSLQYEQWYNVPHRFPSTLKKAVYGLPEIYRKRIKKAKLIANPGCYPTGALLGLLPALKKKLIDPSSITIDSKSGTSGAGRNPSVATAYCEVNEGFKAYAVGTHRHIPEIEQEIAAIINKPVMIDFTPHLLPVDRGILTTIYARFIKKLPIDEVLRVYRNMYRKEPFVRVLPPGSLPNLKNVRGTNYCDIGLVVNTRTNTLIIITVIDNLVKGASGQAVQNMNLILGYPEKTAIDAMALFP